jgi:hypothetical protein
VNRSVIHQSINRDSVQLKEVWRSIVARKVGCGDPHVDFHEDFPCFFEPYVVINLVLQDEALGKGQRLPSRILRLIQVLLTSHIGMWMAFHKQYDLHFEFSGDGHAVVFELLEIQWDIVWCDQVCSCSPQEGINISCRRTDLQLHPLDNIFYLQVPRPYYSPPMTEVPTHIHSDFGIALFFMMIKNKGKKNKFFEPVPYASEVMIKFCTGFGDFRQQKFNQHFEILCASKGKVPRNFSWPNIDGEIFIPTH